MLGRLSIQNFRSIQEAEIRFGPITVFFGPTSSGKSSVLYSLLMLRNLTVNPGQSADGLFNLGFLNLGGFDACVFNHIDPGSIGVTAHFLDDGLESSYGVRLRKVEADVATEAIGLKMTAKIPIPYGLGTSWPYEHEADGGKFTVNWNGFACTAVPMSPTPEAQAEAAHIAEELNAPVEALKRIDVSPHRRGFFKPSYTPVPLTPTPATEDEVATLIINDQNSPPRISIDTIEIFGRDFRTFTPPGTATTFLQTTEQTAARVPGLLVNDGFGVNQVVYMLAKIHAPSTSAILIEEPEVHLHPSVIRKFARVAVRLATEEDKQLVFTTHSEQFLLSLLGCAADKLIEPNQLVCYQTKREKKRTSFELQEVNQRGQIEGGLSSFMQAELEDIKTFLAQED